MSIRAIDPRWRCALAILVVVVAAAIYPAGADARDLYPCGPSAMVAWSQDPVQPCPLTSPTGPNESIPVYRAPIANPSGKAPPSPYGWLRGVTGKYFVCQRQFTAARFYHPSGWYNNWWAYTRSDEGRSGWVPQVYFKGGANDERDAGLRACPVTRPAPQPPSPPPPPPAPPVSGCEPTPAAQGPRLEATFRNRRRSVTVGFGRTLPITGRMIGSDGQPLAGVAVCVGVQASANAPVRAIGSVTTDGSGRFTYQLGSGPSRRVWFVHREHQGAVSTSMVVRVRAPIALRASRRSLRNGQAVALRGRLRAPVPARGLLVEMQAARGRKWQTFATTRTRRGGAFGYRYRFTRTLGVQRYRLRARISAQPGNPFATGASRPVRVRVVGA